MIGFIFDYVNSHRKPFIYSGVCIIVSFVLIYFARTIEGFAQWYATIIFPLFNNTFGRLSSLLPFSVLELGLYITFIALLILFFRIIWLLLHRSPHLKLLLSKILYRGLCIISSLLLVFTMTGSINYSRSTFASSYGLPVQESTSEELTKLTLLLIEDISYLTNQIEVDQNNLLSLEKINLQDEAVAAMKSLGDRYPLLAGYYPNPKPILFSSGMSYLGITGIYSPLTLEANYNRDVANYVIPFTICHELSHFKGYMKEEEANFIAYLASRDSSSNAFQYSGTLNALIYSLNALYANVSLDEYKAVYALIPERVINEIAYSRQYWQAHTAPITEIAKATNNKYLMANAQTSGTKSYGKMVDLLLAEYADVIKSDVLL